MTAPISLGPIDSGILVAYVALLASIGWWAARNARNSTEDYFLASRSIPWMVTTASFLATTISALTFVGTPAEGYGADYRYLFSNLGDIAAAFFVALYFLPAYQKAGVTSIYEVIARRFGSPVRTACSGYFLISRTLGSTVRIVAIAKVLEVVSGGSIPYPRCVFIVVGVVLCYTTLGGGRAIAWTDLMQFTLLIGGALAALVFIVHSVPGGIGGIIEAGRHAVRPDGTLYNKFNFLELLKPENLGLFLLLAVWGFFQSAAAYGADQDMVQRLLACNDRKRAGWSLMISGLVGIPIASLFLTIGVGLYAYARVHPELIAGMTDNDHVFPRFILTVLPEGLRGLLLAAVASAAMGSSDSALASLATAFTLDFYKPFWGKGATEEQCVRVSKLSYVGFGVLFMIFALAVRNLDHLLWLGFRIVAFTYGPLLGVFAVANLTRWRVDPYAMLTMMFGTTLITFGAAMMAWGMVEPGVTTGFWYALHNTYWRFYIIAGALLVPLGAWLAREEATPTAGELREA
ncbi:MAG: sodium/solute symporter [Candidatus Wallbacteria bacterium]|nr:sodium/solute symporter [Candidatus Wallbacteria bacterium]